MNIVVAGIHTGTGKTVCSAVLAEALGFDYWKPVQAGALNNSDSMFVRRSTTNTVIHREAYALQLAASPHIAAQEEGTEIRLESLSIPAPGNNMIIETAGGVMSPLSNTLLNLDLMKKLGQPVVLVADNYLGSINHTLLTIAAMKEARLNVLGIIFCGKAVASTRDFILQYTSLPLLLSIPEFSIPDKNSITTFAAGIAADLKHTLHGLAGKR